MKKVLVLLALCAVLSPSLALNAGQFRVLEQVYKKLTDEQDKQLIAQRFAQNAAISLDDASRDAQFIERLSFWMENIELSGNYGVRYLEHLFEHAQVSQALLQEQNKLYDLSDGDLVSDKGERVEIEMRVIALQSKKNSIEESLRSLEQTLSVDLFLDLRVQGGQGPSPTELSGTTAGAALGSAAVCAVAVCGAAWYRHYADDADSHSADKSLIEASVSASADPSGSAADSDQGYGTHRKDTLGYHAREAKKKERKRKAAEREIKSEERSGAGEAMVLALPDVGHKESVILKPLKKATNSSMRRGITLKKSVKKDTRDFMTAVLNATGWLHGRTEKLSNPNDFARIGKVLAKACGVYDGKESGTVEGVMLSPGDTLTVATYMRMLAEVLTQHHASKSDHIKHAKNLQRWADKILPQE